MEPRYIFSQSEYQKSLRPSRRPATLTILSGIVLALVLGVIGNIDLEDQLISESCKKDAISQAQREASSKAAWVQIEATSAAMGFPQGGVQ